jgi:hypothetical protein
MVAGAGSVDVEIAVRVERDRPAIDGIAVGGAGFRLRYCKRSDSSASPAS